MTTSASPARGHDQPRHRRMQERHVAGDVEHHLAGGGGQPGEDAAERAVVGIDVGDHRHPEERVERGRVRHDQDIVHYRGHRVQHPLDDAAAAKLQQRLGLAAHARALAAGLDHAGHAHEPTSTAPARSTRGGSTVTSSTVEGAPPAVAPAIEHDRQAAGEIADAPRRRCWAAAGPGVGARRRDRLAERGHQRRATGCAESRTPTVPEPAVTPDGTSGRARQHERERARPVALHQHPRSLRNLDGEALDHGDRVDEHQQRLVLRAALHLEDLAHGGGRRARRRPRP